MSSRYRSVSRFRVMRLTDRLFFFTARSFLRGPGRRPRPRGQVPPGRARSGAGGRAVTSIYLDTCILQVCASLCARRRARLAPAAGGGWRRVQAVESAVPYIYLLRCRDGSLYAGAAKDLERRLAEHRAGQASRYTRSRLPVELAWWRQVESWGDALREEALLKRLRHAAREELL